MALAADLLGNDQVGVLEDGDVLHHGDATEVEEFGDVVHVAARLLLEDVEDAPARRGGQRREHGVHLVGFHMSPNGDI